MILQDEYNTSYLQHGLRYRDELREMTLRQLWEWANDRGAADYTVLVQDRDTGGFYDDVHPVGVWTKKPAVIDQKRREIILF